MLKKNKFGASVSNLLQIKSLNGQIVINFHPISKSQYFKTQK